MQQRLNGTSPAYQELTMAQSSHYQQGDFFWKRRQQKSNYLINKVFHSGDGDRAEK
jgi:hypothetical protein